MTDESDIDAITTIPTSADQLFVGAQAGSTVILQTDSQLEVQQEQEHARNQSDQALIKELEQEHLQIMGNSILIP
jgi:hypothetical protein